MLWLDSDMSMKTRSLFYWLPNTRSVQLQRVRNAWVRLVCDEYKHSRITLLLGGLHWLPVGFRTKFKIILATYKILDSSVPQQRFSLSYVWSGYCLRSCIDEAPILFITLLVSVRPSLNIYLFVVN